MWTPWDFGCSATLVAAIAFALTWAMMLSVAAERIPRRLGFDRVGLPKERFHRRRVGLLLVSVPFATACVWAFGATLAAAAAIVFVIALLTLAWIDADTGLLPDLLTLPLLWLGLLVNLNGGFVSLQAAVLGAIAGYGVLWLVYQCFLFCTGREGIGYGDFKLLAAMGAWLGWASLPWLLLTSSSLALVVALVMRASKRLGAGDPLCFGPYLAVSGIVVLFSAY